MEELEELLQRSNALEDNRLQNVVKRIMDSGNLADMKRVVEQICNEKVMLSVSKEAMKIVAEATGQFDDMEKMGEFEQKIRECTLSRQSAYEEALSVVYEIAARKYEGCGRKKEAAEELARLYDCINETHGLSDSRSSGKSAEYLRRRINLCVKAASLLMDDDVSDFEKAGHLLQRVSDKVTDLPASDDSVLQYKLLYAKLFDLRHDFIRASQKYIELVRHSALQPDQKFDCLKQCALCVILADAGPERSNVLAVMFKDERIASVPCYPFLKKIQQQHILRPAEVDKFKGMLSPHQIKKLPGEKRAPIDHAVMLHNLFSAANIYTSIRLDDLALLLGLSKSEAEATAADMIRQKRINAKIDQIKDMLFFSNKHDPLAAWDSHVDSMCTAADEAATMINKAEADAMSDA